MRQKFYRIILGCFSQQTCSSSPVLLPPAPPSYHVLFSLPHLDNFKAILKPNQDERKELRWPSMGRVLYLREESLSAMLGLGVFFLTYGWLPRAKRRYFPCNEVFHCSTTFRGFCSSPLLSVTSVLVCSLLSARKSFKHCDKGIGDAQTTS